LLVLQVVLWPMRLTAGWSTEQTLWLGGILSGWMLVAGWMTAIGCQSKTQGGRILTMLLLVALVLGEPLVRWLLGQMFVVWPVNSMGLRWIGPIDAVQALGAPGARWSADKWAGYAWGVLGAGVMGWLILLLLGLRLRREARIAAV
ncbi:MAG: hypothetical protein HC898_07380, partial [Phycisphaerales bacterium]|nr:hypothetical protein [Phycisphaerales bacterium]